MKCFFGLLIGCVGVAQADANTGSEGMLDQVAGPGEFGREGEQTNVPAGGLLEAVKKLD